MAAIDKIYVTKKQFILLKHWYETMVDAGLINVTMIPFDQYDLSLDNWDENDEKDTRPVWNLSVEADMWLLSNCPFNFVKKNIKCNYNILELEGE